jgi:integrase
MSACVGWRRSSTGAPITITPVTRLVPSGTAFAHFVGGHTTKLHALGVDDLTIQRILRHSDVEVTQQCYIKTRDAQSIAAMDQMNTLVDGRVELICNESAKNAGRRGC